MSKILNFEMNEQLLFKSFLFLWIMSIPFKNIVFQASSILMVVYFVFHLFKTKDFIVLKDNFNQTKILFIGFVLIIFSMLLGNISNLEILDKKSWSLIFMFIFRYGLMFVILAYFYKLDYFSKKDIVLFCLLSFFFLGLTGVYQVITYPQVILGEGIVGTLDNRNAFGLSIGMGFVLSLLLIKDRKILGFLLISFFAFLMIFSFCRSSWVASFSAAFVFFSLNYKDFRLKHLGYLFIFLGFLLLLYFSFDSFQTRFAQLLEGNSSNRTMIWQHTLVLVQKSLLVGYGMDSWKNLGDEFLLQYPDSHNMILEILIKTGIIGLITCFLTIAVVLFKIFKTRNYILLPVAIYFLVITQFDFGAFGSKELLSFLTIFVFYLYSDSLKLAK